MTPNQTFPIGRHRAQPLAELSRLCRRICLRHEHQPDACSRPVDDELAEALDAVREKFGPESVTSEDLSRAYEAESQRLADATALAEILISRLQLHKNFSVERTPAPSHPTRVPAERPAKSATNGSAPKSPPGIADLLDGMLAQERDDLGRSL